MEKDFSKLIDNLMEGFKEFIKGIEEVSKEATGKTFDEIMAMPTDTQEERKAFVDELLKIKGKLDGSKPCDFEGQYIKITGGKTCTQFEAKGSKRDLVHLLAQGVSAAIKNMELKEDKVDEFLDMFKNEVKEMLNNGIML
jgi:hypothetical protein